MIEEQVERNCGCAKYVMRCFHLGEYSVVILRGDDGYGAMIRKGEQFLTASAATGTEVEMEEHFGNLKVLVQEGTMQRLMEYADG